MALRSHLYELHYNLGYILHQKGDLPEAADSYRQAISLFQHSGNAPDLGYADAHYNLGTVLDEQGQRSAAIQVYRQAIALQPDHITAYNNLGCTLIKQGQWSAAIQVYQEAIALKPDWSVLYNNLGQALLHRDVSEAIAAYRRAIELQPDSLLAHDNLGKAWLRQGQHSAAVDCFHQVLQLDPDHVSAQSDCGFALMAQGKLEQAMVCFQKAVFQRESASEGVFAEFYCDRVSSLESDPASQDELIQAKIACGRFLSGLQRQADDPQLLVHLAQTYTHLGNVQVEYGGHKQYQQAEIYYQKALKIQPTNLDLYLRLGDCLAKQRRFNAAIVVYHTALAVYPHHAQFYFQLGIALEKQQQPAGAIGYYRKVLELRSRGESGWGDQEITLSSPSKRIDLPRGICHSTYDWIAANLDSSHYIQLSAQESSIHTIPGALHSRPIASSKIPDKAVPPLANSQCDGLNCGACLSRIFSWFEPLHLGKGVYACAREVTIPVESPSPFVAVIPKGRAWVVPRKNAWMICNAIAIMTPDNHLLADVSRDYPGQLPGCENYDPTQHRIFSQESLPPLEQIDGTVGVLVGLSGHVYFHWIADILPRIEILRRSGMNLAEIDWFLVNDDRQPFQKETLSALGIPAEKILPSDRHPHIQARLVLPSFPGHLGWLEPWALEFLRQTFLSKAVFNASDYPERVYISRADASYRRVLNEADVVNHLSESGFVPVVLESLSFWEQVALFASVKVIIAPHGSGLTNTVFCRPGTQVIELVSPHYIRHYYWIISKQLELEHYYLVGEKFSCHPIRELMYPNPLTEDILVNLDSLKRMLKLAGLAD